MFPENLGRVERGGLERCQQRHACNVYCQCHGLVHRKDAPGDRLSVAGEDGSTVCDKHFQRSQAVQAGGRARSPDRVRDEHEPFRRQCGYERDQRGVYVDAVSDDLERDALVSESCSDGARPAVVDRRHCVEKVRGVACSGIKGQLGRRIIGVGVTDRDDDAGRSSRGDQVERTFELRRDRHEPNRPVAVGHQVVKLG